MARRCLQQIYRHMGVGRDDGISCAFRYELVMDSLSVLFLKPQACEKNKYESINGRW